MDSLLRIVNILFVMLAIWQSKVIFELTHQSSNTARNSELSAEATDQISQIKDNQHKLDQQIKDVDRNKLHQQQVEYNTLLGITKVQMAGAEVINEARRSSDLEILRKDLNKLQNSDLTLKTDRRNTTAADELEPAPQKIILTKSRPRRTIRQAAKVETPSNLFPKVLEFDRHQISEYITPTKKKFTPYPEDMSKFIQKIHPPDQKDQNTPQS
jgi:hypothetical protein